MSDSSQWGGMFYAIYLIHDGEALHKVRCITDFHFASIYCKRVKTTLD